LPSTGRTHAAVAADLVDVPVDLQVVAVRIGELDRKLAAGAPAPLVVDRHVVLAQVLARPQHLVQRGDLERHVMERAMRRLALGKLEQRHAMMVGGAAQEHRAARHHVAVIGVGNGKAHHLGVELRRGERVLHVERHVADLVAAERHALRAMHLGDCLGVHGCTCLVGGWSCTRLAVERRCLNRE
jgi:hypothetical protein